MAAFRLAILALTYFLSRGGIDPAMPDTSKSCSECNSPQNLAVPLRLVKIVKPKPRLSLTMEGVVSHLEKMSEDTVAFQRVRKNFQRVCEFGWFAPLKPWTKSFRAWPEGKCLDGLGYRQAAVLFLLSHRRGELHVLITRRSYHVSTHKGNIALINLKNSRLLY